MYRNNQAMALAGLCGKTRPCAAQSLYRQTRTGEAEALVERHIQVQHKALCGQTRTNEAHALESRRQTHRVQQRKKILAERHVQVQHRLL
jgi:hypothetical protein